MSRWIGQTGEQVVVQYAVARGWQVLACNWHCRWGELDIVAHGEQGLVFIEVKTRKADNWDEQGLLAIDQHKQEKLIKSAQAFLQANPALSDLPCRFDVALVQTPAYQIQYLEGAFTLS
ncbi:MAG: YraN family protein [Pseudanabaenaceae cyanobacterium]